MKANFFLNKQIAVSGNVIICEGKHYTIDGATFIPTEYKQFTVEYVTIEYFQNKITIELSNSDSDENVYIQFENADYIVREVTFADYMKNAVAVFNLKENKYYWIVGSNALGCILKDTTGNRYGFHYNHLKVDEFIFLDTVGLK